VEEEDGQQECAGGGEVLEQPMVESRRPPGRRWRTRAAGRAVMMPGAGEQGIGRERAP